MFYAPFPPGGNLEKIVWVHIIIRVDTSMSQQLTMQICQFFKTRSNAFLHNLYVGRKSKKCGFYDLFNSTFFYKNQLN